MERNIQENTLIFVPYQDSDNFYEDGILTREFAMLYMLESIGFENVINIKKPRTFLDRRRYKVNNLFYPNGTIEGVVKDICDRAKTIQYTPFFSVQQILKRRMWWIKGYDNTSKLLDTAALTGKTIVYSDNPFAEPFLEYLKRETSCYLYFDVMDNFAIHPSLNEYERKVALDGYKKIMNYADCVSANSQQTCDFIEKQTGRSITLVKNGVFANNEVHRDIKLDEIIEVKIKKEKYKKCVGYIGKLGLRLDAELIDKVTSECNDTLFVFVGPSLKGQLNKELETIFLQRDNVLRIKGIPSAYVYSMLNEFDVLMIPHSVGKGENGGDPLKLYQYLTRRKPIITTSILGVSEFEKYIKITNNSREWVEFIKSDNLNYECAIIDTFTWETRLEPILKIISDN